MSHNKIKTTKLENENNQEQNSPSVRNNIVDAASSSPSQRNNTQQRTQSQQLSERQRERSEEGLSLNDDSKTDEEILNEAIGDIISYTEEKFKLYNVEISLETTITLEECKEFFNKIRKSNDFLSIKSSDKKRCMNPDGGIIYVIDKTNGEKIPIFISEMKHQGTNDLRHAEGKTKQGLGNAVERSIKNIRGAEMIFAGRKVFPYALFACGCDFHSSESISDRLVMGNMGEENYYIEITRNKTDTMINNEIDTIIGKIKETKLEKKYGYGIASIFVKAHKYDEMPHLSSRWKKDEIVKISVVMIDLIFEEIKPILTLL